MNRSYSWSKWIKERIRGYIDYSELFLDDNLEERVNKLKQKFVHDYYSEFNKKNKIWMANYGILPKDANKYAELDLKPEDLAMILSFNVPVDYVKVAKEHFNGEQICSLYMHLVEKERIEKGYNELDCASLMACRCRLNYEQAVSYSIDYTEKNRGLKINPKEPFPKRFDKDGALYYFPYNNISVIESFFIPLRFDGYEYLKILRSESDIKYAEKLHPIFMGEELYDITSKEILDIKNSITNLNCKIKTSYFNNIDNYKGVRVFYPPLLKVAEFITHQFLRQNRLEKENYVELLKRWGDDVVYLEDYEEHLKLTNYPLEISLKKCDEYFNKNITPENYLEVYHRWEKEMDQLDSYEEHLELKDYPEMIGIQLCKGLKLVNATPEIFDTYKNMNNEDKAKLIINDISYNEYLDYPDIFSPSEVTWIKNDGKTAKDIKILIEKFPEHNSQWYIHNFIKNKPKGYKFDQYKYSDNLDEEYENRFGGYEEDLQEIELYPVLANKYNKRFSVDEVLSLGINEISGLEANEYNPRFDFIDIIDLHNNRILGEVANMYPNKYKSQEIIILKHIGILPNDIDEKKLNQLEGLLKKIFKSKSINANSKDYQLVGTGWDGLVLFRDDKAWKFSKNIEEEYRILKKINDYHNGKQKHIIKVLGEPIENMALQLEYIEGYSLDKVLKEERHVDSGTILKWGYDILKGLKEMKDAGIEYHRDIRTNNIMIDNYNNAIIIDFMRATENKNAIQIINTRYGSCTKLANDVNGIGQILYAISSHQHIFATSISNTRTFSDIKEEIKDERTKAYNEGLDNYLIKVQNKINDKKLNEFIMDCIKAEPDEFNRIYGKYIK